MKKTITMQDVADEAGVSRALVSVVFRNVPGASEETRSRVFAAADKLGYQYNTKPLAQSSGDHVFGVFVSDLSNGLIPKIYEGINARAEGLNIDLLAGVSEPSGQRDTKVLSTLAEAGVSAILLIGSTLNADKLMRAAKGLPLISLTRKFDELDYVSSDDLLGARLAVEHLIETGHDDIAMLTSKELPADRTDGYRQAMSKSGLEPQIVYCDYTPEGSSEAVKEMLSSSNAPSAIFAANDRLALPALEAATGKVAIAGYDNIAQSLSAGLTTVDQDAKHIGAIGVDTAMARISIPDAPLQHRILDPRLITRASTLKRV